VIEEWKQRPADIKARKMATKFKAAYAKQRDGMAYPAFEMERQARKTPRARGAPRMDVLPSGIMYLDPGGRLNK
jgi:hypothetical protein